MWCCAVAGGHEQAAREGRTGPAPPKSAESRPREGGVEKATPASSYTAALHK